MTPRRLLLADGLAIRCKRLAARLEEGGALRVTVMTQSLTEAYHQTETTVPELVAISSDMALRAEFPMFRALLEAMKATYVVYGAPLPKGRPALANLLFAPLDDRMDIGPLLAMFDTATRAPRRDAARRTPLVLIGASTGGIEALETVITAFPADGPPTLIVQHIRGEYAQAVSARLDRLCAMRVAQARDGVVLQPGHAYLAPGNDAHLEVIAGPPLRCRLRGSAPVSGHRPSIDVLFRSALPCCPDLTGVLLTGMGRDGAEGLLALRRAGAQTIAQDRGSSVVYGMPRVAAEIGAVDHGTPLSDVAATILSARQPAPARSAI